MISVAEYFNDYFPYPLSFATKELEKDSKKG